MTDPTYVARTQRPKKYAGVARIDFPGNPNATHALAQIDETLRRFFGAKGAFLERAVTWGDLVGNGFAKVRFPDGTLGGGGGGSGDPVVVPEVPDGVDTNPSIPPPPTGLSASPAIVTVILQWDEPTFSYFGYTEVWRSSTDNLAVAVHIGETQAFIYVDSIGQSGVTNYYWVRHVSKAGNVGPFNAVSGEAATTGKVGTSDIAALAITNALIGNLAVDSAKIADLAVGSAKIADAAITSAKIGSLQVTDAKISSLAVGKLVSGALAVGQYIASTNYSAGVSGFKINADGSIECSQLTARGHIEADTGYFAGTLSAASGRFAGYVTGGAFTAYAWPAAGSKGFYLGPEGLLIGNGNGDNGSGTVRGYFQLTDDGRMYAPGLSIVDGTLTISQADVIDTLQVKGQAISFQGWSKETNVVDNTYSLNGPNDLALTVATVSHSYSANGGPVVFTVTFAETPFVFNHTMAGSNRTLNSSLTIRANAYNGTVLATLGSWYSSDGQGTTAPNINASVIAWRIDSLPVGTTSLLLVAEVHNTGQSSNWSGNVSYGTRLATTVELKR